MAKILLVEDDKSLREIYGVRLLAEGYDIVSAGDGEEALAMAIKERPQLIVSDVMMPKISGFDMLDILRSTSETKGIKVIMMTALSSEDQRQRGEQLGADRYLVKSQVGIEDVVRTVHEVLGDMPTPGAQQNPFGTAVPRTAPSAAPQMPATTTAPTQPQPAAPAPAQTPAPQPAAPPASSLPQPTAPFSTARPAGLADRIIQPIERPETNDEPLASLMDRELKQTTAEPSLAPPAAPPVPPAPAPEPPQTPVQPQPAAPAPAPEPQQTVPTPQTPPLTAQPQQVSPQQPPTPAAPQITTPQSAAPPVPPAPAPQTTFDPSNPPAGTEEAPRA